MKMEGWEVTTTTLFNELTSIVKHNIRVVYKWGQKWKSSATEGVNNPYKTSIPSVASLSEFICFVLPKNQWLLVSSSFSSLPKWLIYHRLHPFDLIYFVSKQHNINTYNLHNQNNEMIKRGSDLLKNKPYKKG